jgi:hypothetical protein
VVDCWTKVLILVCVDKIADGSNFNNLLEVIMNASLKGGRLIKEDLSKKFLCLKVEKVIRWENRKITKQIKDSLVPFSMGVHSNVHMINLVN